jgi:hypothetical protein
LAKEAPEQSLCCTRNFAVVTVFLADTAFSQLVAGRTFKMVAMTTTRQTHQSKQVNHDKYVKRQIPNKCIHWHVTTPLLVIGQDAIAKQAPLPPFIIGASLVEAMSR